MARIMILLLGSALSLTAAGAASAPARPASEPVCYRLRTYDWIPDPVPQHLPSPRDFPDYLLLDTARFSATIHPEVRAARAFGRDGQRNWELNAWRTLPGDSIEVRSCANVSSREPMTHACPPDFGGFTLRLSTTAETLHGRVQATTDMIVSGQPGEATGKVVGERVACRRLEPA